MTVTLIDAARRIVFVISLLASTIAYANTQTVSGKVVDAKTGAPIAGAFITFGDALVQSDESS